MSTYFYVDVDNLFGNIPFSFAESSIKVSNYAFIDINKNGAYDMNEKVIPVSINFNNSIILPNNQDIFKMWPLSDGSYTYTINIPRWLQTSITQPIVFFVKNNEVIGIDPIPLVYDQIWNPIIQRRTYLTNWFNDTNRDGIRQTHEDIIRYTVFNQHGKIVTHSDDTWWWQYRLGLLPDDIYYYQTNSKGIIQKTYFALNNGSISYDVTQMHGSATNQKEYYRELLHKKQESSTQTTNNTYIPQTHKTIAHVYPSSIFQANDTLLKFLIDRNQHISNTNNTNNASFFFNTDQNTSILSGLWTYQQYTTQQTSVLYQLIFINILGYLKQNQKIDEQQYQEILNKVKFIYRPDCKKFEGNVTFTYTKDMSVLQTMEIHIPSCGRPALVKKLWEVWFELIAHEIGHYLYHHDPYKDLFATICRTNGKLKSSCQDQWFVRDYGRQNPSEDYAESFTLWLKTKNNMIISWDQVIDQKIVYFE